MQLRDKIDVSSDRFRKKCDNQLLQAQDARGGQPVVLCRQSDLLHAAVLQFFVPPSGHIIVGLSCSSNEYSAASQLTSYPGVATTSL